MSEPFDPAQDPEYAAALDRFLDGLLDDPVTSADAQVRADTDAIAKALGLIGGALAAEGSGTTAAAGAVPPVAAGGATVVQMSSWRSKLNPRVLAAAASLVVVVGIGIPLTMSSGGSNSDDAATAAGAPEAAMDRAEGDSAVTDTAAVPAPLSADAYTGTDSAVAGSADAGTSAGGAAAAPNTGQAADEQALQESRNAATGTGAATKAGTDGTTGSTAFADAVACARAIFVGTVTGVAPEPDGAHFKVTFLVEDWIVPDSGAVTVTYRIYGSTANSPGVDENVLAGQRRLFIVPGSEEARISAYREKDWAETRKQIQAVRDKRAGEGC